MSSKPSHEPKQQPISLADEAIALIRECHGRWLSRPAS
jgi:hypothetical protein